MTCRLPFPSHAGTFARMKTLGTILIVLLVILVLLGAGLQIFLTKGLTSALNKGVFPAVKTMYGLEMNIGDASVNILKGTARLQGFAVRNLKGYEKPFLMTFDECLLEVDMMSLLRRNPILIERAEANGAVLTIERNQERNVNVKELADALKPVESSAAPGTEPAPEEKPGKKAEPVPVHIRRIIADIRVLYADTRRNRDIPLDLSLKAGDLFTVPAEGQPDSLIVLRGSLADDSNSFVTDLSAVVEPLTDPANPTFNATGSILDIDAGFLEELLEKNDMESGPFSIRPTITCKQGQLEGSDIGLVIKDLKIYNAVIGETKLTLPVTGTIQRPRINLSESLNSLLSDQALNIGKTIGLRELKKELGIEEGASTQQTLMNQLTNRVEEIGESPALQELIRQVAPGAQPTNSAPADRPVKKAVGDALIEQLEQNVNEIEGNEAVKDVLRGLFSK
jgi:hypothetical protein